MQKRIFLLLLCITFLAIVFGCKGNSETTLSDAQNSDKTVHTQSNLYGFVVQEKNNNRIYEAMHSFITTVADIGKNAKLYRFTTEEELKNSVDEAKRDNCDAVLFYSEDFDISEYAKALEDYGIRTVSLVNEENFCSCSVVFKNSDAEMIKVLSEYAGENAVLVYSSTDEDLDAISSELQTDGYNVKLKKFRRTEYAYKDAENALYSYLVNNESVKAVYVKGEVNTRPAFAAVKKIGEIRIIGSEISEINKEYVGHGMYALCVSPYYEMTAKAVYSMQKLVNGQSVENEYCGAHLVTEEKLEKYVSVSENAQKWFGR